MKNKRFLIGLLLTTGVISASSCTNNTVSYNTSIENESTSSLNSEETSNTSNESSSNSIEIITSEESSTSEELSSSEESSTNEELSSSEETSTSEESSTSEEASSSEEVDKYYTVSFVFDTTTTNKVLEGMTVTKPSDPKKEGYVFKGWYEGENGDVEPFDFTSPIYQDLTLHAIFVKEEVLNVIYAGYNEGMYVKFSDTTSVGTNVYYKKVSDNNFTKLDKELIRFDETNGVVRADVIGIEKGDYVIKYETSNGQSYLTNTINVTAYDRSGYAHFAYASDATGVDTNAGIGAYTNKGTLKSNAVVVYVNDDNKNTVTAKIGSKTYTGLVEILKAQKNSSVPLDVRIIGTIKTAQYNKIKYANKDEARNTLENLLGTDKSKFTYDDVYKIGLNSFSNDIANGITVLNGLTNNVIYSKGEYDSYFNMCDLDSLKNVTVEGIGTDAGLFQWGFTWKKCSSIEVRNLTFDDYTEDACGFEGSDDVTVLSQFKTGHIWIHNNQFNQGSNNWDVCDDQDKAEGDGATDLKRLAFVTLSYNHYIKNHKTGVVGASNSVHQACITFHHNYYEECASRMPLGRQANMHLYNNYYYGTTRVTMSIRASGYAFIEGCYFEGGKNPIECQTDSTNGNGVAKVYNCIIESKGTNAGTIVENRDDVVANTNVYDPNFDTNSTLFYYDDVNKKSDVENLTSAQQAKEECIKYAGVLKDSNI